MCRSRRSFRRGSGYDGYEGEGDDDDEEEEDDAQAAVEDEARSEKRNNLDVREGAARAAVDDAKR